jgi:hypothetical protein
LEEIMHVASWTWICEKKRATWRKWYKSQALEFRTPLFPHLVLPTIMVWIFVWKCIFEPFIHILQHFVLQLQFQSAFSSEANTEILDKGPSTHPIMKNISISKKDILKLINNINPKKL